MSKSQAQSISILWASAIALASFAPWPVLAAQPTQAAQPAAASDLTLWYEKPATCWIEALPIGNGRMGAMVFGGPDEEHLQLNEDTLYSGEPPADLRSLDITKQKDHVVGLLRANKHQEVDAHVKKHWLGRNQQCYQPLGDLKISFADAGEGQPAAEITGYRRWPTLPPASCQAGIPWSLRRSSAPRVYSPSAVKDKAAAIAADALAFWSLGGLTPLGSGWNLFADGAVTVLGAAAAAGLSGGRAASRSKGDCVSGSSNGNEREPHIHSAPPAREGSGCLRPTVTTSSASPPSSRLI